MIYKMMIFVFVPSSIATVFKSPLDVLTAKLLVLITRR